MLSSVIDKANRELAVAFGRRLKKARQERDLTGSQLAGKLGLERSSVTQYEAGRSLPSLPVLEKIARILSVSLDHLCFEEYKAVSEIQDKELAARLAVADGLQHQHRYLIIEFIDSLVAREQLETMQQKPQRRKREAA